MRSKTTTTATTIPMMTPLESLCPLPFDDDGAPIFGFEKLDFDDTDFEELELRPSAAPAAPCP